MPKLFNPSGPERLIQSMVKPIQFRPKPDTSSRLLRLLENIPFFTGPLKVINDTANAGAQQAASGAVSNTLQAGADAVGNGQSKPVVPLPVYNTLPAVDNTAVKKIILPRF